MSLLILFLSAFGAATLLPLQSEAVLISNFIISSHPFWVLIIVASIGNILGSCLNWWLGIQLERFKNRKWFPFSIDQMSKAQTHYQKFGYWSLLLSWVPIIGDPITLIAGVLKEKFWIFLILVSIAKTGRYVFIYLLYSGLV